MERSSSPAAFGHRHHIQHHQLPSLTARIASILLARLRCPACTQSLNEPITLPCGHSLCAPCLYDRARACNAAAAAAYPYLLHGPEDGDEDDNDALLPSRLPLCSGAVPCPVEGCPRSAIGRGIGTWSGYHARYGPLPPSTPTALSEYPSHPPSQPLNHYTTVTLPTTLSSSGLRSAEIAPFDGFIVGVPDHPTNLAILPAQRPTSILAPASSAAATALWLKIAAGTGNAIAIHPLVNDQPATPRTGLAAATHALPVDPRALDPNTSPEGPPQWRTIRSDVTLSKVLELLRSQIAAQAKRQIQEEDEEREAERLRRLPSGSGSGSGRIGLRMLSKDSPAGSSSDESKAAFSMQRSKSDQTGAFIRLSRNQKGKRPATAAEQQEEGQAHEAAVEEAPQQGSSSRAPRGLVLRRRHSGSSASPTSSSSNSPAQLYEPKFARGGRPSNRRQQFAEEPEHDHPNQQYRRAGMERLGLAITSLSQRPVSERRHSQPMAPTISHPGFPSSSSHARLPHGDTAAAADAPHRQHSPSQDFSDPPFFNARHHSHAHSSPRSPSSFSSPSSQQPSRFSSSTHVRSSRDRVAIARSALPLLGGSEFGRESGAAGGIRATSLSGSATASGSEMDSDDYEGGDSGYGGGRRKARRRIRGRGRGLGMDAQSRFGSRLEGLNRHGGGGGGSRGWVTKHHARHHPHDHHHRHHRLDSGNEDEEQSQPEGDGEDHPMDLDFNLSAVHSQTEDVGQRLGASTDSQRTADMGMVAKRSACSGAQGDPVAADPLRCSSNSPSHSAESGVSSSSTSSSSTQLAQFQTALLDVLECQLCYLLLFEPITTPCGHTFCRACFARNLDHSDRCPLCRARMPSWGFWQDHPSAKGLMDVITLEMDRGTPEEEKGEEQGQSDSVVLVQGQNRHGRSPARGTRARLTTTTSGARSKKMSPSMMPQATTVMLSSSSGSSASSQAASASARSKAGSIPPSVKWELPSLYTERRLAAELDEAKARLSAPIFVCTLAYPEMPTVLHIYEPRYRLMVRRCLESGNPRFGMVMPARTSSPNAPGMYEYGTMLEIRSVQMLPDGRSMIETVGSYRFRVLETGTLDGYTVGRVERVEDVGIEEEMEMERVFVEFANGAARAAGAEEPAPVVGDGVGVSGANRVPATDSEGFVLGLDVGVADALANSQAQAPTAVQQQRDPLLPTGGEPSVASEAADLESSQGATDDDNNGPPLSSATAAATVTASTAAAAAPAPASGGNSMGPMLVALHPTMDELVDVCVSFIDTLRSGSAPLLLTRLNQSYGPMPTRDEIGRLAYWMALVIPIDEHEKARLLSIRSARLRLRLVVHWIEQLRSSWWFASGCTVC
ncbi:unnamed protein product [Tilletia laevis]|uniref:RING-type domain-containing protein n=2 Tax=Tilletia TaxID=13289 RepID=A0A177VAV6_9BASI|nr:hypothetical protein CF336_g1746 [Tilletia laevis]KAE8263966.1 hypothetical protein A4X03_0g1294 [Tilletia caries]KAE8207472.1 hypothetical protein CF335_g1109 [Tilletia laevis]CAD6891126.1 unnamed protein product [Tilletia caries]CAD6899847.1 unnamed protein product [Tilletia caries]